MRVLVIGRHCGPTQRIARILREAGWDVERISGPDALSDAVSPPAGYDVIIVQPADKAPAPAILCRLRHRFSPSLLLLSGGFRAEERLSALATGADDMLDADAPGPLLMSRLIALLRLRRHEMRKTYRLKGMTVDIASRRVTRDGRDIALSAREFQLLVLLMQNAGRPLSRSTIIDRLWPDDLSVADNAVDALASRLRRKIDGPFETPLIGTIRGVGYTLIAREDSATGSGEAAWKGSASRDWRAVA